MVYCYRVDAIVRISFSRANAAVLLARFGCLYAPRQVRTVSHPGRK